MSHLTSNNAAIQQVLQSTTNAISNINQTLKTLLPNGAYTPFSQSDASASTNTLFYSTDTDVLTYKDPSGNLHSLYFDILSASATYNPPSLLTLTGDISSGITVTGAAFGDFVQVAAPYDLQGITTTAYVSASDTVKITLFNGTAGTIDLASGTWKVRILK